MHRRPAITEILPVVPADGSTPPPAAFGGWNPRPDYTDPHGLGGVPTGGDGQTVVFAMPGHEPLPPSARRPHGCDDQTMTIPAVTDKALAPSAYRDYPRTEGPVDLPAPAKRRRWGRAPVDGDTPRNLDATFQRVVNDLRSDAASYRRPVSPAEQMRIADDLALANDARLDALAASADKWRKEFGTALWDGRKGWTAFGRRLAENQGAIAARRTQDVAASRVRLAEITAWDIACRVADEDALHQAASTQTLVAGMIGHPAEDFRAQLDAMLAADGLVTS
jgi:hypothetical protein